MQTRTWGLFAATLACACSGPKLELGVVDGQGGSAGGTGGASASGGSSGLVPADWTGLTMDVSGGFQLPPPGQGDCNPRRYHDIYEVDAATQELSWDYCTWAREKAINRRGQLALSAEQVQDVRNAVAALGPGGQGCGADKALILLDVANHSGTLMLQDDFYGCMLQAGRTPVSNIDPLAGLIGGWVNDASEPSLRKLTVVSSGGFVQAPSPESKCSYAEYPNTYSVTLATRELDWDLCRIDVISSVGSPYKGSRTLNESELARITSVFATVTIASPECVADEPRTTLDVETSETTFHYLSQRNGCGPLLGDDPFAANLGQLRFEFSELVPAP